MLNSKIGNAVLALACALSVSMYAVAEMPARTIDVPAGQLTIALKELAAQSGVEFVYSTDQLAGMRTQGVHGEYTAEKAVMKLLEGTNLKLTVHDSGAILITAPGVAAVGESGSAVRLVQSGDTESDMASSETPAETSESLGEKLEEVVVTAQRRRERAIDVPISITAVSGDELAAAGIDNALDLGFAVPGMTVAEIGPGRQIIIIRGMAGERGSSSLTGIYLDEMPLSGAQDGFVSSYIDLRTTDLERVEVLRGPQGTLFGEGAVGGVVRFITREPDLSRASGEISSDVYSTSDGGWSKELTGIANVPIANDVFGIRVAAKYEDKAGWIDQPSIGREDINDSETYNVRVKGLWMPTPELRVSGMAVVHHNDGGGSNTVNVFPLSKHDFIQAFDLNAPTDFKDEYELYNLTAKYNLGFAELLSSTSYAKLDSDQSLTQFIDGEPLPAVQILIADYQQASTIASQEIRLTSSGSSPLRWTVGGLYKKSEMIREYLGGIDAMFGSFSLTDYLAGLRPHNKSEGMAGYANLSYQLTQRSQIGGGLRYFYDDRETFDAANKSATFLSAHKDFVSFSAHVSYAFTGDMNGYVSVGNGFRSFGFNDVGFIPYGAPPSYDPESLLSYEAGLKSMLFNGRVAFDTALFYSKYEDMQDDVLVASPVDPTVPIGYTNNDQNAELKGIEWALRWQATKQLMLGIDGDVTHTEITHRASASPYAEGDPINLVPEYSASLTAEYRFDWAASWPGVFRVDFNRQGKSTYGGGLIPQAVAPEVSFVNARLGFEREGWEIGVYGRNLTDESGSIRADSGGATAQGRPRTIGLSIGKSF